MEEFARQSQESEGDAVPDVHMSAGGNSGVSACEGVPHEASGQPGEVTTSAADMMGTPHPTASWSESAEAEDAVYASQDNQVRALRPQPSPHCLHMPFLAEVSSLRAARQFLTIRVPCVRRGRSRRLGALGLTSWGSSEAGSRAATTCASTKSPQTVRSAGQRQRSETLHPSPPPSQVCPLRYRAGACYVTSLRHDVLCPLPLDKGHFLAVPDTSRCLGASPFFAAVFATADHTRC